MLTISQRLLIENHVNYVYVAFFFKIFAVRWAQRCGPLFERGGRKCRTHGCLAVLAWPCWKFHPFHLVACCQEFPCTLVSANKEIEHGLQKGTRPHRNHHRRGQDVAVTSSSTPRVGRPTFVRLEQWKSQQKAARQGRARASRWNVACSQPTWKS